MPAGLRAAYVSAVQAAAGTGYEVKPGAAGLEAVNPAQGLSVGFSAEGVALEASGMSTAMRPTRWGCDGMLREVESAAPDVHEGRVEYRREGLVEWYVNGPLGVEQGFTMAAAPCRSEGNRDLVVELSVGGGLRATLAEGGEQVELRDTAGRRVLGYSELYATDATGKALPARLGVEGDRLSIRVQDGEASYPVVIDPLIWKQQSKLLASDGAAGDDFGYSVAISGDTAVVGAPYDDDKGQVAGAAYVFVRSGSTWLQQQKLLASDGTAGDELGAAVALSDDTVIVGTSRDDDNGKDAGAAYVFIRSGSTWTEQQKLLASDGAAIDQLGYSVAISGDMAVVGALGDDDSGQDAGSVYIFLRSGATWTQQQKLLASDGTAGDQFGAAVSLSDDTVIVGAPYDGDNGTKSGSAYIFLRSGAIWTQQQKLLASDGAADDNFGYSVALSGDTVVIGAYGDDDNGSSSGAAYVFFRSNATWAQQQKLLPSDGVAIDQFGYSVALSIDTAVIGAYGDDDNGSSSGAAYVFFRSGSTWTQQEKLLVSDGAADDFFGWGVALTGDTVIIGAPNDDDNGSESGSAYVFVRGLSTGDPCATNTACQSGLCFNGVCVDPVSSCDQIADGAPCEDGNPCTQQDACQGGVCVGATPVVCPNPPAQHGCSRGVCDPASGACGAAQKLDGAPCPGGICIAGGCVADTIPWSSGAGGAPSTGGAEPSTSAASSSTSTGAASSSASTGAGGAGGAPAEPGEIQIKGGGCACTTRPSPAQGARWLLVGLMLAARRRRNRMRA